MSKWYKVLFYTLLIGGFSWANESAETPAPIAVEEEFSLDDLDEEPSSQPAKHPHHGRGAGGPSAMPKIRVIADFTVESFLGAEPDTILPEQQASQFSFSSNHNFVVLALSKGPNLRFSVEVTDLVYWNLFMKLHPKVSVEFGKIAIPFTPMSFHQIYGGIVEKPLANGAGRGILVPRDWTEYGVQLNTNLVDNALYSLDSKLWVSNGLVGYTEFTNQTVDFTGGAGRDWDNNLEKAVGLRLDNTFASLYKVGLSAYHNNWTDEKKGDSFGDGSAMTLANIDTDIGYNGIPLPILKQFRISSGFAMMYTGFDAPETGDIPSIPWHYKNASYLEVRNNILQKRFKTELQFRFGTYDDNMDITNSKDLINYNFAFTIRPTPFISITPRYMMNREKVNEVKDDYFILKVQAVL